jgi:Uma2 family endonuclease
MATQPKHLYTFDEYLRIEEKAEYKSEFHAGHVYAMAGASETYSRLVVRTFIILDRLFPECRLYTDLKFYVEQADLCVYPDCMVLCGDPQFWKDRRDVIVNPSVVVEVLSPSTEEYDQWTKVNYYRSARSIQHIILVSQQQISVEHYERQPDDSWTIRSYLTVHDRIPLMRKELPLEELYRGILDQQNS